MAIRSIRSADLRRLWVRGDDRRLPAMSVRRTNRILTTLNNAREREDLDVLPGLHRLTGDLAGRWAVRVDRAARGVFRWEDGHAYDVHYPGHH